jgi:hypothetical protein
MCLPGRLNNENFGLLTLAFIFGSDMEKDFQKTSLATTHNDNTGYRVGIYDAGVLSSNFQFLSQDEVGNPKIENTLPKKMQGRSDLLLGISELDIRNFHTVGTLLAHSQFVEFFKKLGDQFKKDLFTILGAYFSKEEILEIIWVVPEGQKGYVGLENYKRIIDKIHQVTQQEERRIDSLICEGKFGDAKNNLFDRVKELIKYYEQEMKDILSYDLANPK